MVLVLKNNSLATSRLPLLSATGGRPQITAGTAGGVCIDVGVERGGLRAANMAETMLGGTGKRRDDPDQDQSVARP